ncbi:MAG: TldD/PmbA family protein [Nanoarchaeota archaeon]|nr:TldD/PmbA family protein [Nanoarchaeota archaeon]
MKTDYWDVRTRSGKTESYLMQDGKLESLTTSISSSIGARVLHNGAWGFAASDDTTQKEMLMKKAKKIAELVGRKEKKKIRLQPLRKTKDSHEIIAQENGFKVPKPEKISFLKKLEKKAKTFKHVKSTSFSMTLAQSENTIKNSEGTFITTKKPITILRVLIVFRKGNNIQRAFDATTKIKGYETIRELDEDEFIKKICEKGLRLLNAKPAPPGKYEVVIDNRLAGVFFHEAVGHACEADLHLSDSSILKGRLGEQIAKNAITLIDGKRKQSYGYYKYDSEGVKKKDVTLIDKGVLAGLLHSRETASRMNATPMGNGRAMSPACTPIPRMSTTILKKGDYSKKELFEGIKQGIYLKGGSGGQVEPTKGTFIFNAEEAFMIRDGKISEPLRDVSMSGQTLKTLKQIIAVGNDILIDKRGGMCGKSGQSVPVSEFCPHVRIKEVLVGGR